MDARVKLGHDSKKKPLTRSLRSRPLPNGRGEESVRGERKENYAASALAGLSGGVIAPEALIAAMSLAE
jgi:hypothetical protein